MGPPTEQLIRDYLNRLSVIARTKLDQQDRQALVERTRALIELQAGPAATANPAHVRRVMSWIGDPAALVDLEYQRLTAERPGSGEAESAAAMGVAPAAEVAGVPEVEPDAGDLAGSQVTAEAGDPPGVDEAASPGVDEAASPGVDEAALAAPDETAGTHGAEADPPGTAGTGSGAPGPASAEPAGAATGDGKLNDAAAAGDARPPTSLAPGGRAAASELAGATIRRSARIAGLTAARARTLAASADDLARACPLEATALLLIGVGAPIFLPIWLLGAGIALLSKIWDFRDKWVGLAGPVFLMIVGVSALIVVGSQHNTLLAYLSEAWVGASRISRGTVIIGAAYLLWRLRRGPRQPGIQPWNKTHRLG
jgi:hypothetical protein